MSLDFIKDFEKEISKDTGITGDNGPPRYWYKSPCYTLNHIMTGDFNKLLPQGRIMGIAGNSGSGKSFLTTNLLAQAQKDGAYVLVIDSENALDADYSSKIGVDVNNNYMYKSVTTISQVIKIVSSFIKGYQKSYGDDPNAPRVVIAIDSLDMLSTDTELDNYKKGEQNSDMGQRAKQLKQMLRQFVQDVKNKNISMVVTCQVFQNQNVTNGEGLWVVNQAIRYSLSQIILLTKLKLRDSDGIHGIRMKCEGFKTRFTKPFQSVTIEVPYDSGMDPYSGLVDAAVSIGVLFKKGAWIYFTDDPDIKFQSTNIEQHASMLFELVGNSNKTLKASVSDEDIDITEDVK